MGNTLVCVKHAERKIRVYTQFFMTIKVTLLENSENFCPRAKLIIIIPKNQIAQGLSKGRILSKTIMSG